MELYEPYVVVEDQDSLLHLKLSLEDRLLSAIASRILPLLILMLVFLSFILSYVPLWLWIGSGIAFIVISAIIIQNTKTGSEIYFKEASIEIETLRYKGSKKVSILLKDVDHINLEIFNESRVSGAYYRLVLKDGKHILLLKMPEFLNYEKKRFRQLNRDLEWITTKKVSGDLRKLE